MTCCFLSIVLQNHQQLLQLQRQRLLQKLQRVKFTNYLDKNQQLFAAQRYCVHAA